MQPPGPRGCTGKCKSGKTCGGPAVTGADKCRMHLGVKARPVIDAARAETRAHKLVTIYGRKIETTALKALLDEVQWTAGHVAWLRGKVQEIEAAAAVPDEDQDEHAAPTANSLVWGITKRKSGGDDWGTTEEAAPNIWLRLYQAERNHLVKVCAEAIKAGLDERMVRLAENQGALLAQVIRAILDDLNLSPAQQALVSTVVPRHLRSVAG